MLSPNLLLKKKKNFFKFKFSGKNVNGFVLDFEYQVVPQLHFPVSVWY